MSQKHIVHVFQSFRVGGSEVRTCQIINGLGDGYRHTVVSLDGNFAAAALFDTPGAVNLVHAPGFGERSFPANAAASRRWLKRLQPDLLIAHAWGSFEWLVGNSFAKICPDIFSIEGFIADEAHGELPRRRLVRRVFAGRCTALHACSMRLEKLALTSWRVRRERVHYIPNGIDIGRFSPCSHANPAPPVVLGIVASLSAVKNHRLLLDAFRRLPAGSAELQIIGDGPERAALETQAAQHAVRGSVRFFGYRQDPLPLLRNLDIFCLASRSEQMPIAVLEAMGTGLPVVSTDVGDVRLMVCEANRRYVVPPGDAEAYAAALRALTLDASLRAALGAQNRMRCEREFGLSLMLQRHRVLYERCMILA